MAAFFAKDQSVAPPGFTRWLVPPAALAVHLSIGQVYAFSVFKTPMTHLLGPRAGENGNWTEPQIQWIFSIAILFLGLSAAVFGKWLERVGPRLALFVAAGCFGGGFFIAALGVHLHQLWIIYLGYGALGGIGLGIGYIAPVATLIRWFKDRPGLATGLAIMGFGGGALIGSPLATNLMSHFKPTSPQGVVPTLLVMGGIYLCAMLFGALLIRIPPKDWLPAGYVPPTPGATAGMITTQSVSTANAMRTPQFYLLWLVLCLNVTAGIGIIEQAAPMVQDLFRSGAAGVSRISVGAAAGFVGIISLFNMGGRIGWSTASDYIGRKHTFTIFFLLGTALYAVLPSTGVRHLDSVLLFVLMAGVIISMYGGSFATMPAYVQDLFGTRAVGAIYGRVLTAWSTAGILGPLLVNTIGAHQDANGVPRAARYDFTFHVMAALLAAGFVVNLFVRPVAARFYDSTGQGT